MPCYTRYICISNVILSIHVHLTYRIYLQTNKLYIYFRIYYVPDNAILNLYDTYPIRHIYMYIYIYITYIYIYTIYIYHIYIPYIYIFHIHIYNIYIYISYIPYTSSSIKYLHINTTTHYIHRSMYYTTISQLPGAPNFPRPPVAPVNT